jgi:hypothetical protein
VQGDEIRAKTQGGILWMAMAIQVSTRLWLGGVLSTARDMQLIVALIQKVRHSALCRSLLFCVDGCPAYVRAIQRVFREPIRNGRPGRPRLRPWDGIYIAQVVKQYAHKPAVKNGWSASERQRSHGEFSTRVRTQQARDDRPVWRLKPAEQGRNLFSGGKAQEQGKTIKKYQDESGRAQR